MYVTKRKYVHVEEGAVVFNRLTNPYFEEEGGSGELHWGISRFCPIGACPNH